MKLYPTVREIMNKDVETVALEDTISHAAKIMKEKKIGSLLIKGYPIGIITATDIIYKHVAEGKGNHVKDIATSPVITISPNRTVEQAAKLLAEKNIEKLPVLDGDKIVGIVTATDILKVQPSLFEILLEKMQTISEPEAEQERMEFSECESCGNYSDDVEEVDGKFLCSECRS